MQYSDFSSVSTLVFFVLWRPPFVWLGGILGSASGAEFPFSLSNHVGLTPRLLYSSTHHSPESFTHLKTGWAQDAWLLWSYENRYFHLDISLWLGDPLILGNWWFSFFGFEWGWLTRLIIGQSLPDWCLHNVRGAGSRSVVLPPKKAGWVASIPTKCFIFWCRLVWPKNNWNKALTEKQIVFVLFCVVFDSLKLW